MSEQRTDEPGDLRERKPPMTDSPWFWVYIFSTSALIALALAGPKYFPRQTQLERQFLARQEGGQTIKGADGQSIAPPTGKNLIVTLGPLFVICGTLLIVAWSRLWWTRVFPQTADTRGIKSSKSTDSESRTDSRPTTASEADDEKLNST